MAGLDVERRKQELRRLIEEHQRELSALEGGSVPKGGRRDDSSGARRIARPLRAIVLDALEDLQTPAYTREIMQYVAAVYGERPEPTRFGGLRQKEQDAYLAGRTRTVFICCGVTETGESIKRLLARSDWDLMDRVIAPTTGRTQYLRVTRRLCDLALQRPHLIADFETFKLVVADHARDLPGVNFKRAQWEPEKWRELAHSHLAEIEEIDRQNRAAIAMRLRNNLTDAQQLFGTEHAVEPEPKILRPITEASFG